MTKWKDVLVTQDVTILEAMRIIDDTTMQFVAVVAEDMKLLGTVTDGDIRRAILKGLSLEHRISDVMNESPTYAHAGESIVHYKKLMQIHKLKQLPILSEDHTLQSILFADQLKNVINKENKVVLMVGGLGTRLHPLTKKIPKPMLNVGSKPILETIIESFKSYGYVHFILCVNYKKEMIMDYFQDGTHLGVSIEYIEETKRLGTAGALSLLEDKPTTPFFVMNGDLLTKVNFEQLMEFHHQSDAVATMCVREYEFEIPYGVIETDNEKLLSIEEKPIHKSFVNAGIYVLDPEVLMYIPKDRFYDMPELYKKLIHSEKHVSAFPLREYWLDIGHLDDYERANSDYEVTFYD